MRRYSRLLIASCLLIFALWCLTSLRQDLAQISLLPIARFWPLALLATGLSLCNYALRITRWKWYLSRLGHRFGFRFAALTYVAGFAFTLSPGKLGELARARYYTECRVPLADVAAAFCAERLLDVIAVLALSIFILDLLPGYGPAIWAAAVAVGLSLLAVGALPWQKLAATFRSSSTLPRRIAGPMAVVAGTLSRTGALQHFWIFTVGFLMGLIAWGAEGLGLCALAAMFPPHLAPLAGIGIYAIAVLVGAISFLPGGLGSTEAAMTTLLVSQGYAVADALLITMLCRIVTLWLAIALGWSAIAALRHRLPMAVTYG